MRQLVDTKIVGNLRFVGIDKQLCELVRGYIKVSGETVGDYIFIAGNVLCK